LYRSPLHGFEGFLMSKMKIKKLPVVEPHGRLGLITLTDVARFQPQIIYALKPSYRRLFKEELQD